MLVAVAALALTMSGWLAAAPASAQTGPDAPTGLTATVEAHFSVTLEWDDLSDASITGYEILRRNPATQDVGVFPVIAA